MVEEAFERVPTSIPMPTNWIAVSPQPYSVPVTETAAVLLVSASLD